MSQNTKPVIFGRSIFDSLLSDIVYPQSKDDEDRVEARLLRISRAVHGSFGLQPREAFSLLEKFAYSIGKHGSTEEIVTYADVGPDGDRKSFRAHVTPSFVTIFPAAEAMKVTSGDLPSELDASRPNPLTGINGRDSTEQQLRAAAGAAVRISGAGVNVVVSDISDEAIEKIAKVVRFRSPVPQRHEGESAAIGAVALAKDREAEKEDVRFRRVFGPILHSHEAEADKAVRRDLSAWDGFGGDLDLAVGKQHLDYWIAMNGQPAQIAFNYGRLRGLREEMKTIGVEPKTLITND